MSQPVTEEYVSKLEEQNEEMLEFIRRVAELDGHCVPPFEDARALLAKIQGEGK
jgi:hypothetical protein